ncbi:MAG TPA: AIR synthase-related protein, partial [Deltaproteobacteria bacterium]|nr:AIR synthase-related protein [Deltaproteobacteria bacterium]
FSCPLISGKDSMKNDYIGPGVKISIPPTILISVIGTIDDVQQAVTMDLKHTGDILYLLGPTKKELGASEYFASFGVVGSSVPKVDASAAMTRYRNFHTAAVRSLIASAHDLSDGGLAVALAECAFAGDVGVEVNLGAVDAEAEMNDTEILYSESQSRILISVSPENAREIESIFGSDARRIGVAIPEQRLIIRSKNNEVIIDRDLASLKRSWKATLDL